MSREHDMTSPTSCAALYSCPTMGRRDERRGQGKRDDRAGSNGRPTDFALAVEIGDWSRFTGTAIGSYVGLVPSEYSFGASRVQGGIAKTGNGQARRLEPWRPHTPPWILSPTSRPAWVGCPVGVEHLRSAEHQCGWCTPPPWPTHGRCGPSDHPSGPPHGDRRDAVETGEEVQVQVLRSSVGPSFAGLGRSSSDPPGLPPLWIGEPMVGPSTCPPRRLARRGEHVAC